RSRGWPLWVCHWVDCRSPRWAGVDDSCSFEVASPWRAAMNPLNSIPASEVVGRRSSGHLPLSRALGRACAVAALAALAAVAALAASPPVARAEGVREDHPNLVGGEILGRGFLATFNYERFLNNHFGIGGGLMAFGTSDGVAGVLPLYASFLPGDIHSLYLGAGAAYVGAGDVQDYESTWVMQFTAGYQFHSQSGFWVRPTFTLNVDTGSSGDVLIWPGI